MVGTLKRRRFGVSLIAVRSVRLARMPISPTQCKPADEKTHDEV